MHWVETPAVPSDLCMGRSFGKGIVWNISSKYVHDNKYTPPNLTQQTCMRTATQPTSTLLLLRALLQHCHRQLFLVPRALPLLYNTAHPLLFPPCVFILPLPFCLVGLKEVANPLEKVLLIMSGHSDMEMDTFWMCVTSAFIQYLKSCGKEVPQCVIFIYCTSMYFYWHLQYIFQFPAGIITVSVSSNYWL